MSREIIQNFCDLISKDSLLVQGTGGNVSWKDKKKLWVKASGTSLSETLKKNIFVPLDLEIINSQVQNGSFNLIKDNHAKILRPSIETMFHAILPYKYVLHLHAVDPLSSLVRQSKVENHVWEKCPCNPILINYKKPGDELAKEIYNVSSQKFFSKLYLLKNHGIIVASNDIYELQSILNETNSYFKFCNQNIEKKKILKNCHLKFETENFQTFPNNKYLNLFTMNNFFTFLDKNWEIYPDHIVFFEKKPKYYNDIETFLKNENSKKNIVFLNNLGLLINKRLSKNYIQNLQLYFDVLDRQTLEQNLVKLSSREVYKLKNWEAEKYRKNIIKD